MTASISRLNVAAYGNDPANWRTSPKTPGAPLPTGGIAPVIVTQPTNTSGIEGQSASFSLAATGSALGYIWTFNGKALGAASAATDMTSAEMVAVPELRDVILRALDEAAAVARACGIALADSEKRAIFDKLTSVGGGGTGASKSSMATDIALKRRTEIDTIHGSVSHLGREKGVQTPTIDTMIAIVKGLEAKYALAAGKPEQGRSALRPVRTSE